MKRRGHLFPQVCSFAALTAAAYRAAKGKKACPAVARFLMDIEGEVLALEEELAHHSSRQRPDAACSRMRRLRQCTDHRPGPVPAAAGQTPPARRRLVGPQARTPPPGNHRFRAFP
jgi:hypothetical protein